MKKAVSVLMLALLVQVGFGGLVGQWEMDGTDADLTLQGDAAIVSGALSLDGDGDWADSTAAGVTGAGARTIAAWIKVDEGTANGDMMVTWGSSWTTANSGWLGGRFSFKLNNASGELRAEIGGGFANGTIEVDDGTWHHVAMTMTEGDGDIANIKFYVDGVLDSVSDYGNSNAINTQADTINFGVVKEGSYTVGYFDGLMGKVRVYDEELTQAAIGDLVAQGAPIPEPATMVLLGLGSLVTLRKRK